jgi:hypothetical protein
MPVVIVGATVHADADADSEIIGASRWSAG